MNCPSCNSSLEQNTRFCGVCGYRLQAGRAASPPIGVPAAAPRPATAPAGSPQNRVAPGAGPKAAAAKARLKQGDEIYIGATLNNRFKVESKIGEGGFGAVYRGIQLATGRKVALKLLHPAMTKDENLVARFRREGMVLCNLRDAHTITTYDFDQTPDGTLYIAMELLEGRSLHHIFHEQAPLEWKRVFKILTEMCSSLAEAHSQGIVHRDLKPENIYLETRPGNPEFVKILDFGITKVMRGETIDPASPQLTATGQTLGTLEYMSPEQLMGKPLDGRSDVYALGVVAYEMITGRLPFPDAKGPAGLITAQLKQTPLRPSEALAKKQPHSHLPEAADRVILKCLEKDKNNRYPDVSALAAALQDVIAQASNEIAAAQFAANTAASGGHRFSAEDLLETRRGEVPQMEPPPVPQMDQAAQNAAMMRMGAPPARMPTPVPPHLLPQASPPPQQYPMATNSPPMTGPGAMHPHASISPLETQATHGGRSTRWIWWIVALLALGAASGAVLALLTHRH